MGWNYNQETSMEMMINNPDKRDDIIYPPQNSLYYYRLNCLRVNLNDKENNVKYNKLKKMLYPISINFDRTRCH
jgi:hypothetical protein